MFWQKRKPDESVELCLKRLVNVETRLLRLELEQDAFRDKVLRKMQKAKTYAEDEEPKDIYNGMLIPDKV